MIRLEDFRHIVPDEAKAVGEKAREKVRKQFLITGLLSDYPDMLNSVMKK